jgi:hypothetical protein
MNKKERVKMVKCMEYIARNINDESIFDGWLMLGVADGDIVYGDLDDTNDGDMDYYIEDTNFAYLMHRFIHMMKKCDCTGGLVCDGVLSDKGE